MSVQSVCESSGDRALEEILQYVEGIPDNAFTAGSFSFLQILVIQVLGPLGGTGVNVRRLVGLVSGIGRGSVWQCFHLLE